MNFSHRGPNILSIIRTLLEINVSQDPKPEMSIMPLITTLIQFGVNLSKSIHELIELISTTNYYALLKKGFFCLIV